MKKDGKTILFLSDAINHQLKGELEMLYPDRVAVLNFAEEKHELDVLKNFQCVITMVNSGENVSKLDYNAITEYARGGGKVVSCLFEYAANRDLHFSKVYVGDRIRPAMRIEVENDITRGYSVGDEVWWFGTVTSAADPLYDNQMFQRQVCGVVESEALSILGTSNLNAGAVMVEEKVGDGRILALDMVSPQKPYFNSKGATNKLLFFGNFISGSVRYGKHYRKRLSYDEFIAAMHCLAEKYPSLALTAEGPCSDGRQMWTFELGDESNPTIYLGAVIHGWEWENAFGLLRLTELLCENPHTGGLDASRFHFKIMPIQNPWGYDHFTRHNARGVDLNRNFDIHWDEFQEAQDVTMPWDYCYKGSRAASEKETQIIQGLVGRYLPMCAIDFHTADYVMLLPHKCDRQLVDEIHGDIKARLKDRYICQRPYGGPYQQVNMDRVSEWSRPMSSLYCYAAEMGAPASFLIEMSGNRDDVHALVMNTDTVVEICLAAIEHCLKRIG